MMIFTSQGLFTPSPDTTDKWFFGIGFVIRNAGFVKSFGNLFQRVWAFWGHQ